MKIASFLRNFLLILFFINGSLLIHGQSNTVKVTGVIINNENSEPLIGANIWGTGIPNGVATDINGTFKITNAQKGKFTLYSSFIGFKPDTSTFQINRDTSIVIRLTPSNVQLAEVEIVGIAQGAIKAFLDQKQAENIKNVVSAEQIETFPDLNAAEVLQRLPGITLQRDQGEGRFVQLRGTAPELTTFNVNGEQIPSPEGDVRYVGMDVIPSDQIEFIEVNKVLTPDMDADGIAGSVNIKTKSKFTKEPQVSASLAGGYSALRGLPNYQGQFSFGQKHKKLGFHINASYFENNQGSDNIEYKYAKGPFFGSQDAGVDNYFVQFREVQLRHYMVSRERIGVSPTLEYQFNDSSKIYLRGMYNSFKDDETRRRKIYDLDDALSPTYFLYGGINHDVKQRTKTQELTSLSLGGEHQFKHFSIDYQVFYALAKEDEPNRVEAVFDSQGQAIAIDFDMTDPNYPVATFPNENNSGNATDYEAFELDQLLFSESVITDRNLTPRVNIEIPMKLFNATDGYFKFGGKIRMKEKFRDIRSQEFAAYYTTSLLYPGEGPELTLSTINDGFSEDNLLNKGYGMEAIPSADLIADFYERYPQFFILDRLATSTNSFGEDYQANETIYAAYAMARQDYGKLMVLGGVRFEETHISYEGRKILSDGNRFLGMDTLKDKRIHPFLLPQVQLKYALNKNFNIRAAYTESYSRPNFDNVLPYRKEEDREEVQFGNPDLKYPRSSNFDFLVEQYFKKGILSGGVFYKNIDNFIFNYRRFAHEGDPANFGLVEITTPLNGIRAEVFGAEAQAQFMFNFLKGFWSNFGIYANYTYTESEALINKRIPANYSDAVVIFGEDLSLFSDNTETETIQLPGQAKHSGNFALIYDAKKLFIRLTLNYQDDFLNELGGDKDLDEYYDRSLRLDLTTNYQFNRKLRFFGNVRNLTNAPLRYYLGSRDYVQLQEYYSWWAQVGMKFKI